ncbi:TPA: hypothetical protein ACX3FR_004171 [Vibrio parahaemolyticus]
MSETTVKIAFAKKLELVRNSPYLIGFKEGVFIRFYNESLFTWNQWAIANGRTELKVLCRRNREKNTVTYYGGLPINVAKALPVCVEQEGDLFHFRCIANQHQESGWDLETSNGGLVSSIFMAALLRDQRRVSRRTSS